jgi:hypothetical protein
MVAGTVFVGDAEVAGHDGPIDSGHDLGERDLLWRSGQHVASAHSALGSDQPGALQSEQDLLEIGLGEPGTFGDIADRGRGIPFSLGV